ncbi:invasin domain 3-containing protein, partial [Morganella sp. EGD-HP17]|uniref:invasin domain 3-containing protein n=1 Tax=Morganella sp. EGD-HP17 TaxID=1435146 RepID=UPI000448B9BB
ESAALTATTVTVPNATQKAGSSWADHGDGRYTGTYVANTAGTGLKATLQLGTWGGAAESAAYAITAGNAVQATSAISTNNTTYTAGEDITVTVTLNDAQGNGVAGESAALTATTVTVPNATQKAGSSWTDNGDGSYTGTYTAETAGTGLKATLQLGAWGSAAESAAYTIMAGEPAEGTSAISTDNTAYTAGTDITVTVTLNDAQGNAVKGLVRDVISAVTVPNATVKSGTGTTGWRDNGDGSYTGTYVAHTAGTGLKATLQLGEWGSAAESAVYTITPGSEDWRSSGIAVDNTSYISGSDITVTVTLKDAQGNALSGRADELAGRVEVGGDSLMKEGSSWTDNGDGTYTGIYVANKAGIGGNYYAVLYVGGVQQYIRSRSFVITAGSAAQATSVISTDRITYTAGMDIEVAVTLYDAQGNYINAESAESAVSASTVTVPNASLKPGSNWTLKGRSSYVRTYVAETTDTGLKATLQLDTWDGAAESGAYSITAGRPAQATSVISVDNTSYTAGNDIIVTISFKDAQGNSAVAGGGDFISTVTVPNATQKAGGWTNNGDGSYTSTYVANTAGTELKALLQLSDWDGAAESAAYAITAGNAAEATSVISTDKTAYTAGEDITVTVTLNDAQGNGVAGESAALTATTVTVPNATQKAGSWTDNGDGSYTGTYTAETAGTGLKATLQLGAWGGAAESAAYAITAGNAAQATSSVSTDNATYTAGTDITVTVTLKDAQGNGVAGESAALTAITVTVPNATMTSGSSWTDNGDGSYTGTYTAETAGTGLKVSLQLNTWDSAAESAAYAITADSSMPDKDKSELMAEPQTIMADGSDESELTLVLRDANGNGVSGQTVLFSTDLIDVKFSIVTDKGDGVYTATLTGTNAGAAPLTVTVNGTVLPVAGVTVNLTGDAATATVTSVYLNGVQTRKIANGTDSFEFIAEVRDENNNPVSDVMIDWTSTAGTYATFSDTQLPTDAEGKAFVKLISTKTPVNDIVVRAAIQGKPDKVNAEQKVSFEKLYTTSVLVIDAVATGDKPIIGAHVKILTEDGSELLFEDTTDATGKFKVDLVGGKYLVEITAANYESYNDFMEVTSNENANFKFALSPALGPELGRIILSWSASPKDLDAHLLVPRIGGGTRYNVGTGNKTPAGADAVLDIDAMDYPGIETITIANGHVGTYRYYVRNYSGPSISEKTKVNVQIILNQNLTLKPGTSYKMSFSGVPNSPSPVYKDYNWIVFDLIVDENNEVEVVPIETVSKDTPT